MKKVIFTDPNGEKEIISDIKHLKSIIIDDFKTYWMQGSGDGFIDFYENDKKVSTLLIGPNIEHGLYLHYIDNIKHIDLLSLNNENELEEVLETAEEIYASKGLFLPIESAWEGIMDFIETGNPSSKIIWITPDNIPENGNW
ncbi:MAG: hypothetical protein HDT39_11900 [Lachnospiraceae bacterium]|nr:hypothetical protein [Lachnospiraceae bacterium]